VGASYQKGEFPPVKTKIRQGHGCAAVWMGESPGSLSSSSDLRTMLSRVLINRGRC